MHKIKILNIKSEPSKCTDCLSYIKDIKACKNRYSGFDIISDGWDINKCYEVVYIMKEENIDDIYTYLEKLFEIFNIAHPEDYHNRSMSVSDIIQIDDRYFFCASVGFIEINKQGKEVDNNG